MAATKAATQKFMNILTRDVYPEVGSDVTTDTDLHRAGKKLIGRGFLGVYASDTIPRFPKQSQAYCIINTDTHSEPGSHWLGVAKRGQHVYLYDSFGRAPDTILPELSRACREQGLRLDAKVSRPEQRKDQNDCGARSLAWLLLCKRFGTRIAKLISE